VALAQAAQQLPRAPRPALDGDDAFGRGLAGVLGVGDDRLAIPADRDRGIEDGLRRRRLADAITAGRAAQLLPERSHAGVRRTRDYEHRKDDEQQRQATATGQDEPPTVLVFARGEPPPDYSRERPGLLGAARTCKCAWRRGSEYDAHDRMTPSQLRISF